MSNIVSDKKIKTIFFGGGTPTLVGYEGLKSISDAIRRCFDCGACEEITFEANPNPIDETIHLVDALINERAVCPRVRFSFGVQSFDNDILKLAKRQYHFDDLVNFFGQVDQLKQRYRQSGQQIVVNTDLIAFGSFDPDYTLPRSSDQRDFFDHLCRGQVVDSWSVYTLEIFEGSERFVTMKQFFDPALQIQTGQFLQETVAQEFAYCVDRIVSGGHQRYEVSSFARKGKACLHNQCYRTRGNYLGFGISAASLYDDRRWTNPRDFGGYYASTYESLDHHPKLSSKEILRERIFLGLRMCEGIDRSQISRDPSFDHIIVDNWQQKIASFVQHDLCIYDGHILKLTDKGMNVMNTLVSDLLKMDD